MHFFYCKISVEAARVANKVSYIAVLCYCKILKDSTLIYKLTMQDIDDLAESGRLTVFCQACACRLYAWSSRFEVIAKNNVILKFELLKLISISFKIRLRFDDLIWFLFCTYWPKCVKMMSSSSVE